MIKKITNQVQPGFNQRQFETWAERKLNKAAVKGVSSMFKSAGTPDSVRGPASETIVDSSLWKGIQKNKQEKAEKRMSFSVTAGSAIVAPGSKYGVTVKRTKDILTGETKTKAKIGHASNNRLYVQGGGEVKIGEGVSVHASAGAESSNGRNSISGAAGIRVEW